MDISFSSTKKLFTIPLTFAFLFIICNGLPLSNSINDGNYLFSAENYNTNTSGNESAKDLYIVKAVVYEIGILTNVSNENETSSETQERVDLTFFDTHKNDSHIDLGRIPLPIQTNVSGLVLTAIAPVNIGAFSNPSELLESLPLAGTILNITHSDTAYFQLSAHNMTGDNIDDEENIGSSLIIADEIGKIPDVVDVLPELNITQSILS